MTIWQRLFTLKKILMKILEGVYRKMQSILFKSKVIKMYMHHDFDYDYEYEYDYDYDYDYDFDYDFDYDYDIELHEA